MKTDGTNLLLLTISAFWGSSRWPLATLMSSRRQRSIQLDGRYRQVSLYHFMFPVIPLIGSYSISKSNTRFLNFISYLLYILPLEKTYDILYVIKMFRKVRIIRCLGRTKGLRILCYGGTDQ